MGTLASGSIDLNSLQVAGKPNKYITDINNRGITIHPELISTNSYYTIIDGNGLKINKVLNNIIDYTNDSTIANFGADGIILGNNNGTQAYMLADYHSLQLIDKDSAEIIYQAKRYQQALAYEVGDIIYRGDYHKEYYRCMVAVPANTAWDPTHWMELSASAYLHISDLRNIDGIATLTETFFADGENNSFDLYFHPCNTLYDTSINGSTEVVDELIPSENRVIIHQPTLVSGDVVKITYNTIGINKYNVDLSFLLKAYTLGSRRPGSEIGIMSLAEGWDTEASGFYSHAEGCNTTASGKSSHAEGNAEAASGDYSHAEGLFTTASGESSHAEGYYTIASGSNSHAEGIKTIASGSYSHAEGGAKIASGSNSHAEGYSTIASGYNSHAEGDDTTASGNNSHAEGEDTIARGFNSHAQNLGTQAQSKSQTVIGEYNELERSVVPMSRGNYAFVIGNGTGDDALYRSNALTVDWSGNVKASGNITDGTGNVLSDKLAENNNGDLSITRNLITGGSITDGNGNILSAKANSANMFYITNVTPSGYNFDPNQYRSLSSSNITTYSGYTPIIVQARCTNKSGLHVFNYSISNTTLNYEVVNRTSSQINDADFAFRILHIRNELIG